LLLILKIEYELSNLDSNFLGNVIGHKTIWLIKHFFWPLTLKVPELGSIFGISICILCSIPDLSVTIVLIKLMSDFSISPARPGLSTISILETFNGRSLVSKTLNEFDRSFFRLVSKSTNLFWNRWFGDLLKTTLGISYDFITLSVDVFTGFSVFKIWSEYRLSIVFNTFPTFFL